MLAFSLLLALLIFILAHIDGIAMASGLVVLATVVGLVVDRVGQAAALPVEADMEDLLPMAVPFTAPVAATIPASLAELLRRNDLDQILAARRTQPHDPAVTTIAPLVPLQARSEIAPATVRPRTITSDRVKRAVQFVRVGEGEGAREFHPLDPRLALWQTAAA